MPPTATDAEAKLTTRARTALVAGFERDDLRMLVSDHFDVKLNWVVNDDRKFETVVFDLIGWAEQNGQLLQLLTAAAARREHRKDLADLRDDYAAAALGGPVVPPADLEAVTHAVIRFNERFAEGRRRLAVLEANKTLHDILHQLQENQPEVERLVAAAAAAGYDPLDAADVTHSLRKWAQRADAYVPPAPTADRRRRWVAKFADAVEVVCGRLNGGPPPPHLDRAVALLAHLPADQQPDLNERLGASADGLDVVSLSEPLAAVRAAVGMTDAHGLVERLVAFQGACGDMKRLNAQHQLCQQADDALREADGLPRPTAGSLAQWPQVTEWLNELAAARSGDTYAGLVVQTAARFAAAPPERAEKLLIDLRQRFGKLFFGLDSELLDATDRVIRSAEVLDARLSRYMP